MSVLGNVENQQGSAALGNIQAIPNDHILAATVRNAITSLHHAVNSAEKAGLTVVLVAQSIGLNVQLRNDKLGSIDAKITRAF